MKTSDVVRVFGSQKAVARLLGITPAAISQWGEEVPDLRQFQIKQKRRNIEAQINALKPVKEEDAEKAAIRDRTDIERERAIARALTDLTCADNKLDRYRALRHMQALIDARSQEQIRRLELKRGLG